MKPKETVLLSVLIGPLLGCVVTTSALVLFLLCAGLETALNATLVISIPAFFIGYPLSIILGFLNKDYLKTDGPNKYLYATSLGLLMGALLSIPALLFYKYAVFIAMVLGAGYGLGAVYFYDNYERKK